MKKMMKKAGQKFFNYLGYELQESADAFYAQNELVKVREPVILDVGAHIGSVTKIYRKLFPFASIYCFEPFPQSFESLKKSFEGDVRISCFNTAVSDKKGKAILNANIYSATNSLLVTDKRGSSYWGKGVLDTKSKIEVDTTTIDCFFREQGFSHVDILKLDVQGAEFAVLNGAKDVLSSQKVSLIYTEIIMCPTYEGQHKLYEYLAFLDSLGYEFLDLYNPVRHSHRLIQADVILLSSSFIEAQKIR